LKIVWLAPAVADRDVQVEYIAQDSISAALEVGDRIMEAVARLGDHPEMGREGRVTGTRELVVGRTSLVVIYRVGAERVEVLRVLHGAQMWPPSELNI
jgi:toxin ParE1/3/4